MGSITSVAIRQPTSDLKNHTDVLRQLKESSETASRQRGDPQHSYAQVQELVATGIFQLTGNTLVAVTLYPPCTVAALPTNALKGARGVVIDATSPTFLGSLTGGGTVVCPVVYNGNAWVAG